MQPSGNRLAFLGVLNWTLGILRECHRLQRGSSHGLGSPFLGIAGLRDRVLSHYLLLTPEAPRGFYFSLDVVSILLITFPTL